jgi:uncharacterized Tic20 family protein
MLGYLGVPFLSFLPPLLLCLTRGRVSWFARRHGFQALNFALTLVFYNLSGLIIGTMLALDSVTVALSVAVPLVAVLWLAALAYIGLAGIAASRGEFRQLPTWICATIVRPQPRNWA